MFVIMGAGGQTGGAVARALLAQNQPVRAVLRPGRDGGAWAARGAEVTFADVTDATALTAAFTAFSQALGRPVTAREVPRAQWQQTLEGHGMPPRLAANFIEMWDGFNSGRIRFEGTPERGTVTLAGFAARAVPQEASA